MRKALAFIVALSCLGLLFVAAAASGGSRGDWPHHGKRGPALRALVYHETTGFRHASIPYAIQQLTLWGAANGVDVTADQTSAQFTDRGLRRYDVIVFLSTVGGVRGDAPLLTDAEWAAFQRYIRHGGGYAGIHAASDCCDESEWYGELIGNQARFDSHPGGLGGSPGCIGSRPREPNRLGQTGSCFQAVVETEDPNHPSTRHLPARWEISDELYNFKANPRSTVHVLQTLDESSYDFQPHPFIRNWGNLMGEDHPITWCQHYEGARVWYTGLGHDANIYAEHDSMTMIMQGILWAAGEGRSSGCREEG
jgi:type 1 glutamine amidotransferase